MAELVMAAKTSLPGTTQVIFTDGKTWSAIGPGVSQITSLAFAPIPAGYPVIDISKVISEDDLILIIYNRHVAASGAVDVPALLADMVALGAVVS